MSDLAKELHDIASRSYDHPEHGACTNAERLICGEAADRIEDLEEACTAWRVRADIDKERIEELEDEEELSNKAWDIQRERIEELEAGIEAIAPWLSASLTDHEHDGKGDYLKACNEIFKLDQRKNESNTP